VQNSDNTHLGSLEGKPALAANGNIYVPDSGNNRIQILNAASSGYVNTFGSYGTTGNDKFSCPNGIAISPVNGYFYIADRCNHRVQVYDSTLSLAGYKATLGETGVSGSDATHFKNPRDVAVDASGNIYVADQDNHRVQKCTLSGNSGTCTTFVGETGISGNDFGHLGAPAGIVVDGAGRVYVADRWNNRIQVFDSSGAYLTSIGQSSGNRTGQLRSPSGITLDSAGNIYVADRENHRIQKYVAGVPGWTQTNINGFGARENQIITSLGVFGAQLYAGTYNWSGSGAQLWRTGSAWTSVVTDGFGDTNNAGIDHLIEFNGNLYASTWNQNMTTGVTNGGQIWRSSNGTNWSQTVSGGFGDATNSEVYRFAIFNNQIYASTWSNTNTHGGEIWRSSTGNTGDWTRVASNGFGDSKNVAAMSFETFSGYSYAGTYNWNSATQTSTGGEVWRSNDGTTWNQVNADGFGDANNHGVPALAAFNGYLYASTIHLSGAGSQIWRCQVCDGSDWVKVVDNGFGNTRTTGMNALEVFNNQLYFVVGNSTTGMEVWRSTNGTNWEQVGFAGFGNSNNYAPYWDNAVTVFNNTVYIGTDNSANGGQVWQMLNPFYLYLPLIRRE